MSFSFNKTLAVGDGLKFMWFHLIRNIPQYVKIENSEEIVLQHSAKFKFLDSSHRMILLVSPIAHTLLCGIHPAKRPLTDVKKEKYLQKEIQSSFHCWC